MSTDFGVAISEDLRSPDVLQSKRLNKSNQDQEAFELNQIHASLNTLAMSSSISSDMNGNENEIKRKGLHSIDLENNNGGLIDLYRTEPPREEHEAQISDDSNKVETEAVDHVVSVSCILKRMVFPEFKINL